MKHFCHNCGFRITIEEDRIFHTDTLTIWCVGMREKKAELGYSQEAMSTNITIDEWRAREAKDSANQKRRQDLLNDLLGRPKVICKHCGEKISWSETFGWYHGDIKGGWNTSCEGDESRAEPRVTGSQNDSRQVDATDPTKIKMADILQQEAYMTSWDYVYYDRESAMTIVETFLQNGWGPKE